MSERGTIVGATLLSLLTLISAGVVLLVLYSASYAVWLTAHPMYDNAAWGRRVLASIGAIALVVGLVIAVWAARLMKRWTACRVIGAALAVADIVAATDAFLILNHQP